MAGRKQPNPDPPKGVRPPPPPPPPPLLGKFDAIQHLEGACSGQILTGPLTVEEVKARGGLENISRDEAEHRGYVKDFPH